MQTHQHNEKVGGKGEENTWYQMKTAKSETNRKLSRVMQKTVNLIFADAWVKDEKEKKINFCNAATFFAKFCNNPFYRR